MEDTGFFAGVKVIERHDGYERVAVLSQKPQRKKEARCAICGGKAKKNGVCSAEHYKLWKEDNFRKQ